MSKSRRQSNETLDLELVALDAELDAVAASYWFPATASVTGSTPINYSSKEFDTHNAVTTGPSWRFTCPPGKGGLYLVCGAVDTDAGSTIRVFKNGASYKIVGFDNATINSAFTGLVRLLPGEYIDIRSGTTANFNGATNLESSNNNVQIVRLSR
jgi:hypothetical protein